MSGVIHTRILTLAVATGLSLTACVYTPAKVDPEFRQQVLERWNACLERFDSNLEHYCDGYRRDVLATYPVIEQPRVNAVLMQQTRVSGQSRSIKKVFGITPEDR